MLPTWVLTVALVTNSSVDDSDRLDDRLGLSGLQREAADSGATALPYALAVA
jgi:hypothetical protein